MSRSMFRLRRPARARTRRALFPVTCLLFPVLFGCFATREDMSVLQSDFMAMRAERARADSANQARLSDVIAALGLVNDSLGQLSSRLTKFQGDVRGDLYSMGQQLIQVQELTGQSQRRLQELRASLDQRNQDLAIRQAVTAGDTAAEARAAAPGPNQLFQLSLDQLRRGSAGTARAGFEDLLRQHPTADVAGDAQFYIGESYRAEGKMAAADSAYAIVVERFPGSPRAPTALYKQALSLESKGNLTAARATLNALLQKYPRSDEAALAQERLRTMKD